MTLGDVQVGEQRRDGLGGHRGAAVGVGGSGSDAAVADDGVLDECLGELGVLGASAADAYGGGTSGWASTVCPGRSRG